MKNYILLFFLFPALIEEFAGFTNNKTFIATFNSEQHVQDTIEFSLRWSFIGNCENDCYKFLGPGTVIKINGKPLEEICNHVFAKCPSNLNLSQDKPYRFVAILFNPHTCSTMIDTCSKNEYYLLVEEIN